MNLELTLLISSTRGVGVGCDRKDFDGEEIGSCELEEDGAFLKRLEILDRR